VIFSMPFKSAFNDFVDELHKANQQVTSQYIETVERREPMEFHNEYTKYDPSIRRKR